MITLLSGTTNQDKISEFYALLDDRKVNLKSLRDFEIFPEVVEDGHTFKENAAKKARNYFEHFGLPVFADDSGLEVFALNNEPGVYSARYAGEDATYHENNLLLIDKIKKVPENQRQAQFVCTICYKDKEQELFFTGTTEGIILTEFRGNQGFGYDPLFYVPEVGKTYAELPMQEKNYISHRGKAIEKFIDYLKKYHFEG